MRRIRVSEDTKQLFKPFFDLKNYKLNLVDFNHDEYKRLVGLCLDNVGKNKISINRPMASGRGFLTFIYGIDNDLLLDEFIFKFEKKITQKRYNDLFEYIVRYEYDDILKIEKIFNKIYKTDVEMHALKLIDYIMACGFEDWRANGAIAYFKDLLRSKEEEKELGEIMAVVEGGKKRGRL